MKLDVEKVYTVLELIDDKSKQLDKDEPISISLLKLGRLGVSSYDAQDILSMLELKPGLECIKILRQPANDIVNGEVVLIDDVYHIKMLPKFYDTLLKYEEYALYIRDPIKAKRLFPREDLLPDHRVFAEAGNEDLINLLKPATELAVLTFANISQPQIFVENKRYTLNSMRDGRAFDIVTFCLEANTDSLVSATKLISKFKLPQKFNVKATLQNSYFDINNGPLRFFIEASPKGLKVSRTAHLIDSQLEEIRLAATYNKL